MPTALSEKWCAEGRARVLPKDVSHGFNAYLLTLPWWSSTLRWDEMPPSVQIDAARSSEQELVAWSKGARFSQYAHLAVWFSLQRGGVIVERELALQNLDALYWGAPGVRFSFAIDVRADGMTPDYEALLQFGAGDLLVAVAR